MKKISKKIHKDLRKKLLNVWWGIYIKYKPKFDNTSFEKFLELNLLITKKEIELIEKNAKNKSAYNF